MDGLMLRLHRWWARLTPRERRQSSALGLVCLIYVVHYVVFCIAQPFFIEDAAITFAYSRNVVEGEGLVTFPGGERVEGFSNALWTFVLAGFYALGVPTWTASKLLGGVLGVITLPIVFDLVRRLRDGKSDDVALIAPLFLALSPQFVIWNASGLENSLFCVLLASGVWRLDRELAGRSEGCWSAVLFVALAMTRPEGLAYAVFALVALAMDAFAARRVRLALRWIGCFSILFGAYFAWRYAYFAWEFPNTYYAKQHQGTPFQPFSWTRKGWKYINNYLLKYGIAYSLPLLAFALTGLSGRRRWASVVTTLWLGLMVLWDGKAGLGDLNDTPLAEHARWLQTEWVELRVWSIAVVLLALGLLTLSRRGWRLRGLMWLNLCFGGFFALYSGGDWMKGFRWFNLTSVMLFPLLAVGVGELVDVLVAPSTRIRLGPLGQWLRLHDGVRVRRLLLAVPVLLLGSVGVAWTVDFANAPETATRDIHRRVRYMSWVQRTLDLDHVRLLDVDMGAHMFYSGWDIVDIAGLVDVPMARHKDWNKKFVRQYVFEEFNPEFAHVHSGWARSSKIPTHREWKQNYIEIPGYPIGGRKLHVGNHIRKDIFVHRAPDDVPAGAVAFEGGVTLVSVEAPAPMVHPGSLLFLNTRWAARYRDHGFGVFVVLDDGDGHRSVQAVQPGYGWYPVDEWKTTEHVDGKFRVPIPDELPLGVYNVSLLLMDEDSGQVLGALGPAAEPEAGASGVEGSDGEGVQPTTSSRPAVGEWSTGITVTVGSRRDTRHAAGKQYAAARTHAGDGQCEAVWPAFKVATRYRLRDLDWRHERETVLRRELAGCWLERASAAKERIERADALEEARFWDRHHPDLASSVQPLADELTDEARGFAERAEWSAAYMTYARVMRLDPSRSWTRRETEIARDHMLGIAEVETDTASPE